MKIFFKILLASLISISSFAQTVNSPTTISVQPIGGGNANGGSGTFNGTFNGNGAGLTNLTITATNSSGMSLTNFTRVDASDNTNNIYLTSFGTSAVNGTYNFWKLFIARLYYTNANANGNTISFPSAGVTGGIVSNSVSTSLYTAASGQPVDSWIWTTTGGSNPAGTSHYATNYTTNSLILVGQSNQFFAIPTNTFLVVDQVAGNDALASKTNGVSWASIQSAISNAVDGDTIFVNPGTYTAGFTLGRGISIVGKNRESCIIDANVIDLQTDIIHMQDRSTFSSVTIVGVPHIEGTNCVIRNCVISGVQNPDAVFLDTGWGNFHCYDSWLGSSFDCVAVNAPSVTGATTNSSRPIGVSQGQANLAEFVNCSIYCNAGYTNFGVARGIVSDFNALIRWSGGDIDVRNGTGRTVAVEIGDNGTTNSRIELSGVQLHYASTNSDPTYAVNWRTNVGTVIEYGYFINTNDVHGGTITTVGTLYGYAASNLISGGQIPVGTLFDYATNEDGWLLVSSGSPLSRHRTWSGGSLTNLDASQLSSGKIPTARQDTLQNTYPNSLTNRDSRGWTNGIASGGSPTPSLVISNDIFMYGAHYFVSGDSASAAGAIYGNSTGGSGYLLIRADENNACGPYIQMFGSSVPNQGNILVAYGQGLGPNSAPSTNSTFIVAMITNGTQINALICNRVGNVVIPVGIIATNGSSPLSVSNWNNAAGSQLLTNGNINASGTLTVATLNTTTANSSTLVITNNWDGSKATNLVTSRIVAGSNITITTNNAGATTETITIAGQAGGTVSPTTLTQTNFVLNTVYTNGTQSALLKAVAALTTAAVNGEASLDLYADQAGGNTFALISRNGIGTTVAVTLAMTYTNSMVGVVAASATYYWTNSSVGSGNSSTIISGTGQIATIASGTNGATGPAGSGSFPLTNDTNAGTFALTNLGSLQTTGAITSASGQFNGNGAGVTNMWIVETILFTSGAVTPNGGNRYMAAIGGGAGTSFSSAALPTITLCPSGGYLTNLVWFMSTQMLSTTNASVTFQTNVTSNVVTVDTGFTSTMLGATGVNNTNSGTTSFICPTTPTYLNIRYNSTATLPSQTIGGRYEWWHQSP